MADINFDVVERVKNNPSRTYDEDALVAIIEQLRAQLAATQAEVDELKVELVEARWRGEKPAPEA